MATVEIREIIDTDAAMTRDPANMGAGDSVDKTAGTLRFKTALSTAVDANNPIPIPAAGTNYSFEKCMSFLLVTLDGDTDITNLGFYTSGTNPWTGVNLYAGARDPSYSGPLAGADVADAYLQPVGTNSVLATTDAFTLTSGVPQDMDANDAGPFDATYEGFHVGDLLYLQMDVGTTASAGTLASATLTFTWDETP